MMIIGVAGTIGAGKETLTSYFREKGFIYFETRQIIIKELKKFGLELSRKNMQDWADKLREEKGVEAIMKIMLEMAEKDKTKHYIFDSLRNPGEAEFLKKISKNFTLIGVDAPKGIRFERVVKRAKPSDPITWEGFLDMDERDLNDVKNPFGQHTAALLKMADFLIINDKDLESSMKQIEHVYGIIVENNVKQ